MLASYASKKAATVILSRSATASSATSVSVSSLQNPFFDCSLGISRFWQNAHDVTPALSEDLDDDSSAAHYFRPMTPTASETVNQEPVEDQAPEIPSTEPSTNQVPDVPSTEAAGASESASHPVEMTNAHALVDGMLHPVAVSAAIPAQPSAPSPLLGSSPANDLDLDHPGRSAFRRLHSRTSESLSDDHDDIRVGESARVSDDPLSEIEPAKES